MPASPLPATLPRTARAALWRGACGTCPRCGRARLFRAFLKPVATCRNCGADWSKQRADDFPAYLAVMATGHLLVPLIIITVEMFSLSVGALEVIFLSSAVVLFMGLLQPCKGAVIAAQWWFGMHGFRRE